MKVSIATCRCQKTKELYAIRFEKEAGNIWRYTWAFSIRERSASREGYGKTTLKGTFIMGEDYPGCPSCGAKGFFLCSCGKLNCWDGNCRTVLCQWCGLTGELSSAIDSIQATNFM